MIKSKDDFIRIVSHDIRSPFHAILGFTEMLISDPELKGKLSDENKEFLNLIQPALALEGLEWKAQQVNWDAWRSQGTA